MSTVYLGLGANIGNRRANILKAVALLREEPLIKVTKTSSLYETEPVGYLDQPDFLNAVVEVDTTIKPLDLLAVTKGIEKKLRRRRGKRWGPRSIDIDILLFDDLVMDEPHLHLPHPEIKNRAFVLVPLAEIAAAKRHPEGKTIKELLTALGDTKGVSFYGSLD